MKREVGFRNQGSSACGIRNPGQFCSRNVESWPLESGISLTILTIEIQNPSSIDKDWNPVFVSTRNPESTAWNPESKIVFDSIAWGDLYIQWGIAGCNKLCLPPSTSFSPPPPPPKKCIKQCLGGLNCGQNTKKNMKRLKVSFKAIFNAHFINLVSKEYFSYNVLQFSCCVNN